MTNRGDWRPRATPDLIRRRAGMLRDIRDFMAQRGILEVETPLLGDCPLTDPAIESLTVAVRYPGQASPRSCYLHTSPEYCMKRLLAAMPAPIYQICRVFRDGELGRCHQPEFTMLEWYRLGYDQHRLQDECIELLARLGITNVKKCSYQALFERCGIPPHTASTHALRQHAATLGFSSATANRRALLEVIANHLLRSLPPDMAYFVYDYPACMASLARLSEREHGPVAERFELFIKGVEVANGCHELTDAKQIKGRFEQDQQHRRENGQAPGAADPRLLAALDHGVPDCAGVAWGLDRLLMALTGRWHIETVQCFPKDGRG